MFKKLFQNERLKEMLRFAVSGGAGFVVDYGIMVALKELLGVNYLWASGISFTVSVVVNYLICVFWVFKGAKNTGGRATFSFIASSVVGLGLNQLIMWVMVDILQVYYMLAKIVATGLVMVWNYIMKRRALYGKRETGAERE